MVIYTREEKVLIIPEGEGCGCQGGGQPSRRCEQEIRIAYQSGYTEGYNQGQADCPECDCSSAITEAYQSGYTAGSLMDVELYFTTRNTEEIEGHTKVTFGLYNGRDLTIDGDSYNSTFEALFPPQFQVAPYSFNTKVDIHNVTTVSSVTFTVDCNGQENWIIPSIQSFSINGHQVSNMSFSYVETTPSSGSFIKAAIYTITFDEIHI